MTQLTQENIANFLDTSPHILQHIPDNDWNIPDVLPQLWDKQFRRQAKNALNILINFLNLPYIIDDFKEHSERITWFNSLQNPEIVAYLRQSAIRPNKVSTTNHCLTLTTGYKGNNTAMLQNYQKIITYERPAEQNYLALSAPEKMDVVYNLKNNIFNLFWFLHYKTPQRLNNPILLN